MGVIKIIETELSQIQESRELYFSSLPECQECFVEMLVDEGKYYTISINSQKAGYIITSIDKLISKTQDNVQNSFLAALNYFYSTVITTNQYLNQI